MLLRRRDEPDLRLTLADRDAERTEVFRILASSFRNLAVHSPKVLESVILDAFAWSEFLPVKDRRVFLDEFSRTLSASAEIDTYGQLVQVVREWRATAEVYAEPSLAGRLKRPVDTSARGNCQGAGGWLAVPKRRDRVAPPPASTGWDIRYGTSGAIDGRDQVCAAAPANARVAWERRRT